jgi:SNF2 family DNA or RNA helicase
MRSELYDYQEKAVQMVVEKKRVAVLLRPGNGKTAIALTALQDLGMRSTLVLAPARVVELDVWGDEARKWDHLHTLKIISVRGTPAERLKLLHTQADVHVLSYDNLVWLTTQNFVYKSKGKLPWGAVVFDELSRMKSPSAKRFRAQRYWLMPILVRIGLTGTPVGNHLLDLWGELFTVTGAAALGPSVTTFKQKYFDCDYMGWNWTPKPNAQEQIQERIKPFAFTIPPSLGPKVPLVRVNEVPVTLPNNVVAQQKVFMRQLRVELEGGKELFACSASVVAGKLRQFASGAVFIAPDKWEKLHEEKLLALDEILEEQQGDPVLLFYHYTHEKSRILARYKQAKVLGETCTMEDWNSGRVELMVAHPQSSGFGLNLQDGGSTICWFTLPWSVELWEQAIARLARNGQRSTIVTCHVLQAGTVDKLVLSVLRAKGITQSAVLQALST